MPRFDLKVRNYFGHDAAYALNPAVQQPWFYIRADDQTGRPPHLRLAFVEWEEPTGGLRIGSDEGVLFEGDIVVPFMTTGTLDGGDARWAVAVGTIPGTSRRVISVRVFCHSRRAAWAYDVVADEVEGGNGFGHYFTGGDDRHGVPRLPDSTIDIVFAELRRQYGIPETKVS